jgi:hypothetical protein
VTGDAASALRSPVFQFSRQPKGSQLIWLSTFAPAKETPKGKYSYRYRERAKGVQYVSPKA